MSVLEGWRLEGAPAAQRVLAEGVLHDPFGVARAGEVLRATAERVTSRVTLTDYGDVLLKVERSHGPEELVRALVHPTRARLEWVAAHALRSRGVPVPEPLALAERGGWLGGRTTVYAARYMPGTRSLAFVLPSLAADAARDVLERVGLLVRRMHEAGFDHQDLHAGNLLVGLGSGRDLHVIDLHRGRLAAPTAAQREAALARLLHSLPDASLARPLAEQAVLLGWLGAGEAAQAPALRARLDLPMAAFRRALRRKHDRWALVASPPYARVRGALTGVRSVLLEEARLRRRLEDHDAALAAHDARVLKDRPKSAVTRHGDVVVKETRIRGWRGLLKRLLVPGRLVAGHVNAHRLCVRGIPTARPLACVRAGGRRFTLYEDLSALPRLDDLVRRLYAIPERAPQVLLRDAVADWLAGLHAEGVYHGDVKALHVLVGGSGGAPRFHLIDTDRLRLLAGPVGLGRRVKNLAQLDASLPVSVSRGERLRWLRRYTQRLREGDDERDVLCRVTRILATKRRVVHDALE